MLYGRGPTSVCNLAKHQLSLPKLISLFLYKTITTGSKHSSKRQFSFFQTTVGGAHLLSMIAPEMTVHMMRIKKCHQLL